MVLNLVGQKMNSALK